MTPRKLDRTASRAERRRFQVILVVHIGWLATVFLLAGWWGSLLFKQGEKIAELENKMGTAAEIVQAQWLKTQRMLFWESSSLLALLLIGTLFLIWLYWRDSQRVRAIQNFFASFTHEIRTPLASIRLQAESIADRLENRTSDSKALVHRLLEDTLRLEDQVSRALELARVEGGGRLSLKPVGLRPMIEKFVQESPLHPTLRIGEETVLADPSAVQLIIRNVLENSARHSGSATPQVSITSENVGGQVILRVQDDGTTATPSPSLGNLFAKGPNSTGAGVGLYLIRSLMHAMGGAAYFEAANGFLVELEFQEAPIDG